MAEDDEPGSPGVAAGSPVAFEPTAEEKMREAMLSAAERELSHAKSHLRELVGSTKELGAAVQASAAEGEDVYYFMQRKLDDNFEQILELERRQVEIEVDSDRLDYDAKQAAAAGEKAFAEASKASAHALAAAEDEVRALRPLKEEKDALEAKLAELAAAVKDERRAYMEACAERDRAHVRGKEAMKASKVEAIRLQKEAMLAGTEAFLQGAARSVADQATAKNLELRCASSDVEVCRWGRRRGISRLSALLSLCRTLSSGSWRVLCLRGLLVPIG